MQLKTLRLFCDAAAHGSFSRAAALNDVSQSLVSQAVQSLEERLGTQLVNRSTRPLELTAAGVAYYDGCRKLLSGFAQVEDRVRRISDTVRGEVRIAAIYSVGLLEMGAYVNDFRERHPDVDVRMDYLHPDQVYERIRSDEADVGLVSFPREGGEFRSTPWQDQEIALVVAPGHRLSERRSVSIREIHEADFVGFTQELKIRRRLDRWMKAEGVAVSIVHAFDNVENIKRSVEIGSGVSLLPLQTVRREVESGFLRAIALEDVEWRRPLGIVQKRKRTLSLPATRFVELLVERAAVSPAERTPPTGRVQDMRAAT